MASGDSPKELGRRASELFKQERYEESLEILKGLLEKNPDDAKIKSAYDQVRAKWEEKAALAASLLAPRSTLVTGEVRAVLEDTFEDSDELSPLDERNFASPITENPNQRALQEANRAAKEAAKAAATFGGIVANQARKTIGEGTKMAREAMQQTDDEAEGELGKSRAGCNPFTGGFRKYGFYQDGWADTIPDEGKRYGEFKQTFWNALLKRKGLQDRLTYREVTVKDGIRKAQMELARDGIVTTLVMINRYGTDLYLAWRAYMRLPFVRWKVIVFIISLIPPLIVATFGFWVFAAVMGFFLARDPLLILKARVSEFDHDDLQALTLTIGKCIEDTKAELNIKVALREQPLAGGHREKRHI